MTRQPAITNKPIKETRMNITVLKSAMSSQSLQQSWSRPLSYLQVVTPPPDFPWWWSLLRCLFLRSAPKIRNKPQLHHPSTMMSVVQNLHSSINFKVTGLHQKLGEKKKTCSLQNTTKGTASFLKSVILS